jgi:hypothetical protein
LHSRFAGTIPRYRVGDEMITPTAVNGAIALQRRRSRGLLRPCFAPSHKPRAAKGRRLAARWTASQMPILRFARSSQHSLIGVLLMLFSLDPPVR